MTRHVPPCDDPACMPCWWDALDAEQFAIAAGGSNATCTNVAPVTTDTTREPR